MLEDVIVVLNEREPHKQRAAAGLLAKLESRGIVASRVKVSSELDKTLISRSPKLLIVDYLLGDHATGLDILQSLLEGNPTKKTDVIFWTDEPSIEVATLAIKMGAIDYLELDHPTSVDILISHIEKLQNSKIITRHNIQKKSLRLKDLISCDSSTQQMISKVKAAISKQAPIVIFVGPSGSGRSTLAEAYCYELFKTPLITQIDLDIYPNSIQQFFKQGENQTTLHSDLMILFDHIESDDGTLFNLIDKEHSRIFMNNMTRGNSLLLLGTKNPEDATAISRLVPYAEIIDIPPLSNRRNDIAPLTLRFLTDFCKTSGCKIETPSANALKIITQFDWKGNLKELRDIVIEIGLSGNLNSGDLENYLNLTSQSWWRYRESTLTPDRVKIIDTYLRSGRSTRITAAKLGVPAQLVNSTIQSLSDNRLSNGKF